MYKNVNFLLYIVYYMKQNTTAKQTSRIFDRQNLLRLHPIFLSFEHKIMKNCGFDFHSTQTICGTFGTRISKIGICIKIG